MCEYLHLKGILWIKWNNVDMIIKTFKEKADNYYSYMIIN